MNTRQPGSNTVIDRSLPDWPTPVARPAPTLLDTAPVPIVRAPATRRRRNWSVIAAFLATVLLGVAAVVAMSGRSGSSGSGPRRRVADVTETTATTLAPATTTPTPATTDGAVEDDVDDDLPAPTIPPVPTVPPAEPPPVLPPAPGPAPVLSTQDEYELDPGVHDVTVTLANEGDATLHYEIVNHGDGLTADTPLGEIAPGGFVDVFVELDVVSDGDGPTPFERVVEVVSDGGDAEISIVGQVEKPGYLVAEFDSVPFVAYRATVEFTNVGELPLEITGIEAPGLTFSLLPDVIAGGETIEIEVAICGQDAPLPVKFATPALPLPIFTYASHVVLETDQNSAGTGVAGVSQGFFPPSCQPVMELPDLDLQLGG